MTQPRFYLDQDDSSHWYLIPLAQREAWEAWLQLDGEEAWEAPPWAVAVNGSPTLVTFTDPKVD